VPPLEISYHVALSSNIVWLARPSSVATFNINLIDIGAGLRSPSSHDPIRGISSPWEGEAGIGDSVDMDGM